MRIIQLSPAVREDILSRLLKRDPNQYETFAEAVAQIVEAVRTRRDEALFAYTRQFDGADVHAGNIRVSQEEIEDAKRRTDPKLLEVMRRSMENIRSYHQKQLRQSWFCANPDGTILGQKITALESAGVYVPGGKAAYPSSVLMNIIPAEVAGVKRIAMVTPPGKDGSVNPVTLAAASLAGATEIYRAGGAQAIAALAFGTESVPRVDKIAGPGNIYVALAKKAVCGQVSIDSIAGPSEILVLADETANPRYVAADLLSQAEHDELACAILITTSRQLAEQVSKEADGKPTPLCRPCPGRRYWKSLWKTSAIFWWLRLWKRPLKPPTPSPRNTWRSSPGILLKSWPGSAMPAPFSWENTAASRWATTMPVPTTCCPPTAPPAFSLRWALTILLKNPASFPIPGTRWKRPRTILSPSRRRKA